MTDARATPNHELRPITRQPDLRTYLRELSARSEYLREVPKSELRAQKLDTLFGNVWFFLTPLLQTGVYILIFGFLLEVDRGVSNYPVFLVTGIMVFRFFSSTLTSGAKTIRRNETLMRSLYFPRAIVPIADALGNFYTFLPGMAIVLGVAIASGEPPTWRWLTLPALLIVAFGFVAGCGLISSRLGHIFIDLDQFLPHITRLGFYSSGVIFDPERFTSNDGVLLLFHINPIYQLLSLARWAVMAQPMPTWFWFTAPAYAAVTLVVGFLFFWRGELTYGAPR